MSFISGIRHMFNGGILTGAEIEKEIRKKRIYISDFETNRLNPNSYNLRCGDSVTVYRDITHIDMKKTATYDKVDTFSISNQDGFMLRPGMLYLISTQEIVKTDHYVPLITGRSSLGRLGISIHQEAGFGDIGYNGKWTLQLKVTYPTKIYPYIQIAQIYFITPRGSVKFLYNGRYQDSTKEIPSRFRV